MLSNCDARNSNVDFKFGMFADAFINDVASKNFVIKYLYCLWWGIRNLRYYIKLLDVQTDQMHVNCPAILCHLPPLSFNFSFYTKIITSSAIVLGESFSVYSLTYFTVKCGFFIIQFL